MSTETDTRTPILSGKGLVKRYGHVTAIDGADFELYYGEILAVIGDNGAGKTSMIKALSGAIVPDEGEIRLDGEVVHFKSTRTSRWRPRSTSRRTCSSDARSAARDRSAACCAWSTTRACAWRPTGR
jgi:ABC-type branched-subunit amino acid transport system ATPase component